MRKPTPPPPPDPPFLQRTQAQIDKLFDRMKQGIGEYSLLNDVIFKHLPPLGGYEW